MLPIPVEDKCWYPPHSLVQASIISTQKLPTDNMAPPQLTAGIVPSLVDGAVDCYEHPGTLQVLRVLQVKKQDYYSPDRYRLILSDGHNYVQAMLVTHQNHLVTSGELIDGAKSIIRLRDYMPNRIQNIPVIIILQLDVLERTHGCVIGNPTAVNVQGGET